MEIKEEDIVKIRVAFKKMQTKEDLLFLINFAGRIIFEGKFKNIELKKLTYYANSAICKNRYKLFRIKKKSGSVREISSPIGSLKTIQRCLKLIFECIYSPSANVTGFVPRKSIVDNANFHLGKNYVYNIDLENFFPSIHLHRIKACLQNEPFSLSNIKGSPQEELAFLISKLCTHPAKTNDDKIIDSLPQGAPTSPVVSNIVVQRLDRRLNGLAKKAGVSYSRYADDITFSSDHSVYSKGSAFQVELNRILSDQNFSINSKKVRLQRTLHRQEVTGIKVNERPNVQRSYVKNIRTILNNWEKNGYAFANQEFIKHYKKQKTNIKLKRPNMVFVLGGKLDFLKMVKGNDDSTYQKLKKRFDALTPENIKKGAKQKVTSEGELKDQILKGPLATIHSPQKLIGLLNHFSSNNSPLKYSTHSWDHGQVEGVFDSYNDFIKRAIKQFKTFSYELKELNKNLSGKMYGFVQNEKVAKKPWGMNLVKIGWSSPELKTWCQNNPTKNPMEMILPSEYQFTFNENQITTFRQVVNVFKQEIEIREEGNQLKKIFMDLEDNHHMAFDFNISFEGLEQRSFFTDVQWFQNALDRIFENLAKRTQFKDIYVKAVDSLNSLTITIEQIGSFNENKSIEDPKLSGLNGDLGDIIKNLTNLCDWSVESKFKEGAYRINYLTTLSNCLRFEKIDDCKGFKHIFKFYKPSFQNA